MANYFTVGLKKIRNELKIKWQMCGCKTSRNKYLQKLLYKTIFMDCKSDFHDLWGKTHEWKILPKVRELVTLILNNI